MSKLDITYITESGLVAGCGKVAWVKMKFGNGDREYELTVSHHEDEVVNIFLTYADGEKVKLEGITL